MADSLQTAVAKLKIGGMQSIPSPQTVAQLPGLSDEEKGMLIQAINTGTIQQIWNSPTSAPSNSKGYVPTQGIPAAAVQKRDNHQVSKVTDIQRSKEQSKLDAQRDERTKGWLADAGLNDWGVMVPKSSYPIFKREIADPVKYSPPIAAQQPKVVPTTLPNPPGNPITDIFKKITNPFGDLLEQIKNKNMPSTTPEPTLSAPDIYTPGAAPALPDYYSIKVPESIDFEFKRNPFTKEGKAMAEEAYAPQYETIENLRGAANNQYKRSDKVVDQLYQGLADDLAASAATRQDEYEGAQARVREHASDSAADLGKGYASSMEAAKDVANQMMGYERGSTSPGTEQVITEAAAEQARQQAQSKQEGEKTAGSLARSAATQGDYSQKMGEAYQTQGAVSRENLIDQLNATLGDYANQELNLNSEERQSALSLASMLSDRDWAGQQQNYQMLQDQYNQGWQQAEWQRGLVDSGYNNQWNQYQAGEQGRQFGSQQEWDAYNKALEAKIAAEEARAQAAADAAEAGKNGGGLLDPGDYGGTESVGAIPAMLRNYVTMRDPQNASQVTDAQIQQVLANASGVAGGMGATLLDDEGGMPIFVNMVLKGQPNLTGLQRDIQARAAEYYWNAMRAARISPAK